MRGSRTSTHVRLTNVPTPDRSADRLDATDARLLLALSADPRASALSLAQQLGLARNTVQARLTRLESSGALDAFERRVRPAALGYRLGAYITVQVVAVDADDLWRLSEQVLAIPGVQRTDTNLALRRFVDHRVTPLLERAARNSRPEAAEQD